MAAKDSASKGNIVELTVRDVRFPTSLGKHGSDATHPDPDYSATYVELKTDSQSHQEVGCGLTFTCGRGNEIVRYAVDSLRFLVVGRSVKEIQRDMAGWVRELTNDGQMRWIGPEKGVISLATAAIINAFWDLWAKMEGKPVWKLLCDMSPEQLISLIDFRYIEDCIGKDEALALLQQNLKFRPDREATIKKSGFPAYTTEVGWLGYPDEKIREVCKKYLDLGFTAFKVKVGKDIEDDKRRLRVMRECIGEEAKLAVDANQKWGVHQAIEWMKELSPFNIYWIEEPTSPDDVAGHLEISKALKPFGIGVATGEVCQNKVIFKQFLMSGAIQFCQIDSARMAGLNEVLAVYLMAAKQGVPVCPHAGGVGLCEMVQHLQVFDYICLSGTFENRIIEYIGHLHEHFKHPPTMGTSNYFPPLDAGYSTEMWQTSLEDFEYPHGKVWKELISSGKYVDPSWPYKKIF